MNLTLDLTNHNIIIGTIYQGTYLTPPNIETLIVGISKYYIK